MKFSYSYFVFLNNQVTCIPNNNPACCLYCIFNPVTSITDCSGYRAILDVVTTLAQEKFKLAVGKTNAAVLVMVVKVEGEVSKVVVVAV